MRRNNHFEWSNNEIIAYCNKYLDYIMDSEDLCSIMVECEILDLIDEYIIEKSLSDEAVSLILDMKEHIMDKIEIDVANYSIDELI